MDEDKEEVKVTHENIEEIFKKKKKEEEDVAVEKFAAWNESDKEELPKSDEDELPESDEDDPVIQNVITQLKSTKREESLNINNKLNKLKGRLKIASKALN